MEEEESQNLPTEGEESLVEEDLGVLERGKEVEKWEVEGDGSLILFKPSTSEESTGEEFTDMYHATSTY